MAGCGSLPDPSDPSISLDRLASPRTSRSPFGFLLPLSHAVSARSGRPHCLSSAASHLRVTIPARPFRVFRVFSSTRLPGFFGPVSSVLSADLTTSAPFSLPGTPSAIRFSTPARSRPEQSRRSSPGKTHCLPISRPAPLRFGSPDIRTRFVKLARPPPRCHLAGSLFATYMGSASCFLQTPVSGFALALLALSFRPVTAVVLVSLLAFTRSSSAPCRAHLCSRLFHARLRPLKDLQPWILDPRDLAQTY